MSDLYLVVVVLCFVLLLIVLKLVMFIMLLVVLAVLVMVTKAVLVFLLHKSDTISVFKPTVEGSNQSHTGI